MTVEIRRVRARKVYNSRGEETVEVEVWAGEGYGEPRPQQGRAREGRRWHIIRLEGLTSPSG